MLQIERLISIKRLSKAYFGEKTCRVYRLLELDNRGLKMRKKFKVSLVLYFLTLCLVVPLSVSANILVISPHPDDDIIACSGVIYRALQRDEAVRVVFVTNGDYGGIERGYVRQGEAVTAQGNLGMHEDDLIFLGYPDGCLDVIYNDYPNDTDIFTSPHGQSTTYANRGLGRTDYHTYYFGSPAFYNRYNAVLDLKTIIDSFRPDHIFVTSEFDAHSDHKTTYYLMSMALTELFAISSGYNPTVHKTIIHPSQGSWPSPLDPTVYFTEVPNLSNTDLLWTERESLDVPTVMQSIFYPENSKHQAVDSHVSQRGSWGGARVFYP